MLNYRKFGTAHGGASIFPDFLSLPGMITPIDGWHICEGLQKPTVHFLNLGSVSVVDIIALTMQLVLQLPPDLQRVVGAWTIILLIGILLFILFILLISKWQ